MRLAAIIALSTLGIALIVPLVRYGTLQPCGMLAQEMTWMVASRPGTESMAAIGIRLGAEAVTATMRPTACARVLADYAMNGDLRAAFQRGSGQ
jgi:hypothetical protein